MKDLSKRTATIVWAVVGAACLLSFFSRTVLIVSAVLTISTAILLALFGND